MFYAVTHQQTEQKITDCLSLMTLSRLDHFLLRDVDMHSAYMLYGNVARWLAGWLSVTRRYCIKTAKPILKLFRPSGSPIILVSSDPCADTQFQGNSFSGGVKYTEGGKKWEIFN